jgi:hypothetical protein
MAAQPQGMSDAELEILRETPDLGHVRSPARRKSDASALARGARRQARRDARG